MPGKKRTKEKKNAISRAESRAAFGFLLPSLIGLSLVTYIPLIAVFVLSFFKWNGLGDPEFIGVANYVRLFTKDPYLFDSIRATIYFAVIAVIGSVIWSLFIAILLNRKIPARGFFRAVFYLPYVLPAMAVYLGWGWLYDYNHGLFNYIIRACGGQGLMWTESEKMALWCIILILFTTSIGQPIVLYVSALGNVDHSLVEAAQVDGATDFQVFWKIKWPSIMPTTLYVAVITTINSFQCFALIQLLTSGGPNYSTSTVMYYLYEIAFRTTKDFGYADAMGVILAIVIALFSALQFKVMNGGTTE